MPAVASGRLAVAADPVPGDREHQRGEPELSERRRVDDQAGAEAADRADDRAAKQRDGDERHEQQVRHAAEQVDLGEDRDLDDRRDEEDHRGLDAVEHAHGSFGAGFVETSAVTESSDPNWAYGATCTWTKMALSL